MDFDVQSAIDSWVERLTVNRTACPREHMRLVARSKRDGWVVTGNGSPPSQDERSRPMRHGEARAAGPRCEPRSVAPHRARSRTTAYATFSGLVQRTKHIGIRRKEWREAPSVAIPRCPLVNGREIQIGTRGPVFDRP